MQDFDNANVLLLYISAICCASFLVVLTWRILTVGSQYCRTLLCIYSYHQQHFVKPSHAMALFKRHVLYAPFFNKRHSRQLKAGPAISFGTLPSRLQCLFFLAYTSANVVFSGLGIPSENSLQSVAKVIRHRTGILAIVNLVRITSTFTR